jgi:hypothetical protein
MKVMTVLAILGVIVVGVALLDTSWGTRKEPVRPDIYITRTDSYRTLEEDIIWILEYTLNGEV